MSASNSFLSRYVSDVLGVPLWFACWYECSLEKVDAHRVITVGFTMFTNLSHIVQQGMQAVNDMYISVPT